MYDHLVGTGVLLPLQLQHDRGRKNKRQRQAASGADDADECAEVGEEVGKGEATGNGNERDNEPCQAPLPVLFWYYPFIDRVVEDVSVNDKAGQHVEDKQRIGPSCFRDRPVVLIDPLVQVNSSAAQEIISKTGNLQPR